MKLQNFVSKWLLHSWTEGMGGWMERKKILSQLQKCNCEIAGSIPVLHQLASLTLKKKSTFLLLWNKMWMMDIPHLLISCGVKPKTITISCWQMDSLPSPFLVFWFIFRTDISKNLCILKKEKKIFKFLRIKVLSNWSFLTSKFRQIEVSSNWSFVESKFRRIVVLSN